MRFKGNWELWMRIIRASKEWRGKKRRKKERREEKKKKKREKKRERKTKKQQQTNNKIEAIFTALGQTGRYRLWSAPGLVIQRLRWTASRRWGLSSFFTVLYVHPKQPWGLLATGSPVWPPRLSRSSWTQEAVISASVLYNNEGLTGRIITR